jgi:hypothetical protein
MRILLTAAVVSLGVLGCDRDETPEAPATDAGGEQAATEGSEQDGTAEGDGGESNDGEPNEPSGGDEDGDELEALPTVEPPCSAAAPYIGDNVIDGSIHDRMECEAIELRPAGRREICRRLFADLVGRYPRAAEVSEVCADRSVAEIAEEMQGWEEYSFLAQRVWRDRLDTSDLDIDWRILKDLYAVIDQLSGGSMSYEDFAIEVLAHPGFLLMRDDASDRAVLAFEVFLGRSPTEAETTDVSPLFRAWIRRGDQDPDFPTYRETAALIPAMCSPRAPCRSELFGGQVDLGDEVIEPAADGLAFIWWEDLDEPRKEALREVGRMFVRQPIFWEAAADELLDRHLGWSDGGRFPRRPGSVLPEVRTALAKMLADGASYRAAEREVLSSRLYRQTSELPADRVGDEPLPVYALGPFKPLSAEAWLDSAAVVSRDFGVCDSRYPFSFSFFLLYQAVENGEIAPEDIDDSARRLHELMGHRVPLERTEEGTLLPSFLYQYIVQQIGGCPNGVIGRQESGSLAFAFAQEALAELVCLPHWEGDLLPEDVGNRASVREVLEHQMPLLLGRSPTESESVAFEEAIVTCEFGTCSGLGMAQAVCVALLGSAEMLFY